MSRVADWIRESAGRFWSCVCVEDVRQALGHTGHCYPSMSSFPFSWMSESDAQSFAASLWQHYGAWCMPVLSVGDRRYGLAVGSNPAAAWRALVAYFRAHPDMRDGNPARRQVLVEYLRQARVRTQRATGTTLLPLEDLAPELQPVPGMRRNETDRGVTVVSVDGSCAGVVRDSVPLNR